MKNFIMVLALMSVGSALGAEKSGVALGETITQKELNTLAQELEKLHHNEDYSMGIALTKKLERMEAKQDCMIAAINAGATESVNGCLKKKSVDSKFYVNPNSIGGGSRSSGSGTPVLAR